MLRGYLDVGAVLVGVLDMWEPVSWRFAEVFGLRDEPQHLGPAWAHTPTHTNQTKVNYITLRITLVTVPGPDRTPLLRFTAFIIFKHHLCGKWLRKQQRELQLLPVTQRHGGSFLQAAKLIDRFLHCV